jgi:hypothetical protein
VKSRLAVASEGSECGLGRTEILEERVVVVGPEIEVGTVLVDETRSQDSIDDEMALLDLGLQICLQQTLGGRPTKFLRRRLIVRVT